MCQFVERCVGMCGVVTREELLKIARELRPKNNDTKLNVVSLAQNQGITTILRTGERYTGREGTLAYGPPPKITIYRYAQEAISRVLKSSDNAFLTNAERFSIAHQIGHWVLWDRFGVEPSVNRSSYKEVYWSQEKLVNEFSGSLLVPEWFVRQRLEETQSEELLMPNVVIGWARELSVSKEVMAAEICRFHPWIGFMRLTLIMRQRDRRFALRVDDVSTGEKLILPNRHKHILNERFCQTVMAKSAGSALLRGCSLDERHIDNVWISWLEVRPSTRFLAQRGELRPENGLKGRWVAVAKDAMVGSNEGRLL